MLNRLEKVQQQWGGSHQTIDSWLNERQELLIKYCQLAGLPPYDQLDRILPRTNDIKAFCQILLDYISAGHFEVYDQIAAQCATNGNASQSLAQTIYPQLNVSTDLALAFNDEFAETEIELVKSDFEKQLSALGQALEERFELEDQLIETLYLKHS